MNDEQIRQILTDRIKLGMERMLLSDEISEEEKVSIAKEMLWLIENAETKEENSRLTI